MARFEWSETEDIKEWDDFVIQNNGSIYHSWSWRGVLETTGARPLYLVSRDRSGRTIAVCPFFCEKASRHFSILESLPLSHMAGPIIAPQVTDISEILESLPRSVRSPLLEPIVAMEINVLHQSLVRSLTNSGFNCEANQGLFVLDLVEKKPEDIWNREFEKHDRQAVKYYEEQGASFGFAHLDNEFEDYFALHQDSIIRKNRKPLIQPEFLSKMRVNMGEQLKVAVVKFDNELIGGFSVLCDRRNSTVHFSIIGYSRTKNMHSPVIYLNWRALKWAAENGFRYVNFGLTKSASSSAVHRTKKKFGGEFVPSYKFTLPISKISYILASKIGRVLRVARGSVRSEVG